VVKLVSPWLLVLMVIGEWRLQHNALSATRCVTEQWLQWAVEQWARSTDL